MYRIKKINIDVPRDLIIVENFDEKAMCILRDSRLFCGCCGELMGIAERDINLPCSFRSFSALVKDKSFRMAFGMFHDECAHTMFSFTRDISFITANSYFKQVYMQRVAKGIGLN